jgi:hypothetical protein
VVPNRVLLEEVHLTFTVPGRTPDPAREAARRRLNGRAFRAALRRAVVQLVRSTPALARVRLTIST